MPEALTLTIDDVASILRCDGETAAERINKGELPGLKFGRSWVIPAAAFYQRLNDLALEQAERRRKVLEQEQSEGAAKGRHTAAAAAAHTAQVLSTPAPVRRGRVRRPVPALPSIPGITTAARPNPQP